MNRTHPTRQAARTELSTAGYMSAFSSPGRPELWVKKGSRLAVARRVRGADEDWVILPYPEPATCTAEQAFELAKRDGVVLNGGVLPNDTEPSVPPLQVPASVEGADEKSASDGARPMERAESAPSVAALDPDSDLL